MKRSAYADLKIAYYTTTIKNRVPLSSVITVKLEKKSITSNVKQITPFIYQETKAPPATTSEFMQHITLHRHCVFL